MVGQKLHPIRFREQAAIGTVTGPIGRAIVGIARPGTAACSS